MSRVEKVELYITRPQNNNKALVTVRSWLSFSPEEIGKDFKMKIALYGSDKGETGGMMPKMEHYQAPLYVFNFRPQSLPIQLVDYTLIRGSADTIIHEEQREIPIKTLNEDPTAKGPLGEIYGDNEIYSVVSLSTEGKSEIFHFDYVVASL